MSISMYLAMSLPQRIRFQTIWHYTVASFLQKWSKHAYAGVRAWHYLRCEGDYVDLK